MCVVGWVWFCLSLSRSLRLTRRFPAADPGLEVWAELQEPLVGLDAGEPVLVVVEPHADVALWRDSVVGDPCDVVLGGLAILIQLFCLLVLLWPNSLYLSPPGLEVYDVVWPVAPAAPGHHRPRADGLPVAGATGLVAVHPAGPLAPCPGDNDGMQSERLVGTCTRCTHVFGTLGTDLKAQSVIIKQNFCSGAQEEIC